MWEPREAKAQLLADRASGNLLIYNRLGLQYVEEVVPEVKGIHLWVDNCGIHIQQRGKLVMKRSKPHMMRHFGASKPFQQHEITAQMIGNVPVVIRRAMPMRISLRLQMETLSLCLYASMSSTTCQRRIIKEAAAEAVCPRNTKILHI